MTLELPDVTLVSQYAVCHELTLEALSECCRRVKFGEVQLHTDRAGLRGAHDWATVAALVLDQRVVVTPAGPFESYVAAGRYSTYDLPRSIRTSHALFVHWDSWVADEGAWTDEFLRCDYVGAPWWYRDGYNVGNSGFCLRSKRLLDFLSSHEGEFPLVMPEDDTLCRQYRRRLPQFTWAPEPLAHRFSFERVRAAPRSFGFHGVFNFHKVLAAPDLRRRLAMIDADPHARSRPEYPEIRRDVT